jgi:hypothetical protein
MHFLDHGQVLACEIHKLGRSTWPTQGLFLLDYPRLTQAEEKHPEKPAPADHPQL